MWKINLRTPVIYYGNDYRSSDKTDNPQICKKINKNEVAHQSQYF